MPCIMGLGTQIMVIQSIYMQRVLTKIIKKVYAKYKITLIFGVWQFFEISLTRQLEIHKFGLLPLSFRPPHPININIIIIIIITTTQ